MVTPGTSSQLGAGGHLMALGASATVIDATAPTALASTGLGIWPVYVGSFFVFIGGIALIMLRRFIYLEPAAK
ncbi:hypothetical protein [Arthrobacter sp. A2-55]|uniref:hypothetical protein n=1 Tax=Arthrobacter sp. A2-55 TaxID=2897337 RepID=UPI0021CD4834|nr:hypothetical protein [Arthrobacter sp. A2-55]MCU6481797.1 hypothetical protein [Arthrobacter sp. A2-55]